MSDFFMRLWRGKEQWQSIMALASIMAFMALTEFLPGHTHMQLYM